LLLKGAEGEAAGAIVALAKITPIAMASASFTMLDVMGVDVVVVGVVIVGDDDDGDGDDDGDDDDDDDWSL